MRPRLNPPMHPRLNPCPSHLEASDAPPADDSGVPDACARIADALRLFAQPPFTIQRLCELLADPCRHYASRQKLQAAIEKLCTVSSTTVSLRNQQQLP